MRDNPKITVEDERGYEVLGLADRGDGGLCDLRATTTEFLGIRPCPLKAASWSILIRQFVNMSGTGSSFAWACHGVR